MWKMKSNSPRGVLSSAAALATALCLTLTGAGGDCIAGDCFARELSGTVVRRMENDEKKIALTFDDGPHPTRTPEILAILEEYGIRATFFVIGENVARYPEMLEAVRAAGHEIGNHTYHHPHLKKTDPERMESELLSTEKLLFEQHECQPNLFRPPGGLFDGQSEAIAARYGYTVVLWDVDTRDWAHTPPADIAANVLHNIRPGSIILCHDYIWKDSPTPEALRLFLPELLREGYRFVTVSELIAAGPPADSRPPE